MERSDNTNDVKNTEEQNRTTAEIQRPKPLRPDLIDTAVKFLQNEKVQQSPLEQRRAFLLKKGLTELEIEAAFNRLGAQLLPPPASTALPLQQFPPPSRANWRETVNSILIISGASYGIYRLFREWILPRFFNIPSPEGARIRHLEESVSELHDSVRFLCDSVQQTLRAVQEQQANISQMLNPTRTAYGELTPFQSLSGSGIEDIRSEVATIKSLLLSRNQFPPLPSIAAVGTAQSKNPSWQLESAKTTIQNGEAKQVSPSTSDEESLVVVGTNESDAMLNGQK